jgi:hypothetical protein
MKTDQLDAIQRSQPPTLKLASRVFRRRPPRIAVHVLASLLPDSLPRFPRPLHRAFVAPNIARTPVFRVEESW